MPGLCQHPSVPARVLAFPFRLDPSGVAATVEAGSDDDIDQQIATACLTIPGERIQAPTFGVADPAFVGFELGNLQRHLIDFLPGVTVAAADRAEWGIDREQLTIHWTRTGGDPQ
jgi:hypothetical protein